jgi:predicted ATPase
VANALRSKQFMLVLDNCEHVIDAAARMAEALLRANPAARVIATSREPLRAEGERVYRVPPLAVPPEDIPDTEDPLTYGAILLFGERARAAAANFSRDARAVATIAVICRRLDGIPLAIELAAAHAAAFGTEGLAARLDDRFRLLTRGRRTALPRHQTLRATLDWGYELLTEPERLVLRRLAIFPGGFSLPAAREVVADEQIAASEVDDCVASLIAKSLVTADGRGPVPGYRLLETTRAYAIEKLAADANAARLRKRHAEYYRDLLEPAEREGSSRGQAEWLAIYGGHIDNVRAALDWAFSPLGESRIGVALTAAAVPLWIHLSLLGECRERVEQALASLDGISSETARLRMRLSAALAWSLMYGVGRAREAAPALAITLEIAETLGDKHYQLRALWGLCIDQLNTGTARGALEFARRFSNVTAGSTDPIELMMADRILGTTWHYIGDQNQASHHLDRALAHGAVAPWRPRMVSPGFDLVVSAHYFQARVLWLRGFADQATRVIERNVEEGLELGQALTFCSVLGQAACPITLLTGDLDAAERYGTMLLEHAEQHHIRLWNIWAYCFIGLLAARRGAVADGLRRLRDGLERAGDARFLPRFLVLEGEHAICLATAESHFRRAVDLAHQQGALSWELRAATSLARLWRDQARSKEAHELLAPVYDRFTEGFATADLRAAKSLIEEIS